ncbi:MAG: ATP-grasp domain-containing protein [Candidatus Eiseniibacteriota bacterium]|nr:MAG: ATP-grasp domain-containing protein [Candidatus Eisenbacteria bacterium]
MMEGRVLVIGAGFLQSFVIRRARDMGLHVVAVDKDPNAVGLALAHVSEIVDVLDREACLEVAKREEVDGVLSVSTDFAVRTVSFVAESLGLPGLSTGAARACTNKAVMRRILAEAGVGTVAHASAKSPGEATAAASGIGFPCILKPVDSVGSRGVSRVDDVSQVHGAFESAREVSASGEVIVEEFVEGPEVSVEAITAGGDTTIAAVTDKITSGPPHFVELGHTQPSAFSGQDSIGQTVRGCIAALGIDWSGSHTELRLSADGIRVMEVGARLGGDRITSDLVPLSTGIDLMESVVLLALGRRPEVRRLREKGAAIRYAAVYPGLVEAVEGIEAARSVRGVTDVVVDVRAGDVVPELRSSADRVAHVVAQGADAREAGAAAEEAVSKIRIRVTS